MARLTLGSKRQALTFVALGVVLVLAVVRWNSGAGTQAPPPGAPTKKAAVSGPGSVDDETPAARGGRRSTSSKVLSPDEVPVIDPKDFDVPRVKGQSDTGRDLFDLREPTRPPAPTPTPRPPMPGEPNYVGPLPPPPPTPTPKPPDVSFKFLGSFGPKDRPIAVIQQGDEVFNARAGDTLFGKFVLRKVGYESIDVGFVGFDPNETRRLPITP